MNYSQNDETDILEVLEIKIFFAVQPQWAKTFNEILKNYFHGLYTLVMASEKFSWKKVKIL